MKTPPTADVSLILHNIRSVINVGAIFRTAECAGISKVYLAGYTPAPVDRFGRKRNDFKKAALGAEELVSWEQHTNTLLLIKALKERGISTIALEQSSQAVDYKTVTIENPTAIIVGNEVEGLPQEVLREVGVVAEIPLCGNKESLNVSVAVGIFLFRLLDI